MSRIKVCDAIMGAGKSTAVIRFMNENQDRRYIYIAPYLAEAKRIKEACRGLKFREPGIDATGADSKIDDTQRLVEAGENIASTHACFRYYRDTLIPQIREHGYTLIIDEALDIFQREDYNLVDIDMFVQGGYAKWDNGVLMLTGKQYDGAKMRDLYMHLRANNLIPLNDEREIGKRFQTVYWVYSPELFDAFREVYVLTYLFGSSDMKYYFDIYGTKYDRIWIAGEGKDARFSTEPQPLPEYCAEMKQRIHICENKKYNSVGDNPRALSFNWYTKHTAEKVIIKNSIKNYLRNSFKMKAGEVMWSTYLHGRKAIEVSGYTKSFVQCMARATNEYADRRGLAYCVNLFARPDTRLFFKTYGIEIDDDERALLSMLQWIWRSRIRQGKEIWIYVPSSRMRGLLVDWIDRVVEEAMGGVTEK